MTKKYISKILLIGLLTSCSLSMISCGKAKARRVTESQTEEKENESKNNNESNGDDINKDSTNESSEVESYYTVTFECDSYVKVYIYNTQDLTIDGYESNTAYSRDGDTGELTANGGQVNFVLEFEEGYEIDSINIEGTYKNLKGSADTSVENGYRITKIESDLSVKITSKKADEEESTEDAYKATFNLEHATVYVYETQDVSGDGTLSTEAYARDSLTGNISSDGTGQINFKVVPDENYQVSAANISITGSYANLKAISENVFRITKVASDLTINIEATLIEAGSETIKNLDVVTAYNNEELTLNVSSTSAFTYTYENNVLTISTDYADTFTLSGAYYGNIVINSLADVEIDLNNVTITSDNLCPIYVDTEGNCEISALQNTENTINDLRDAVASDSETDVSASIYATCDLKLKGSGILNVNSENNNGIHSKDDLVCQKLTLNVNVIDNALKGNDSVNIISGTYNLISTQGDGIKSSNTAEKNDVQKGTITISGGLINIYAACDGIDAAFDLNISENAVINIKTDKYSEYSEEVTYVSDNIYYIRSTSTSYKYSIYYYNSQTNEYVWKNTATTPTYTVTQQMGPQKTTYYYYQIDKPTGYTNMYVYVYSSSQTQGQESSYYKKSNNLTINDNYDTIAFSGSSFSFTNYTTQQSGGGMGMGMNDGNSDKGDYSTKGLKAGNDINISGGTIDIESYDDAIHANSDTVLESGATPTGNVTITGGIITVASNDDGIHADGTLSISDGTVTVKKSYEGIEGNKIVVSGGNVKVTSSDDGFNSTLSTGSYGITITGGSIYVYAGGDGLDANTTTSYGGILFNGGKTIVISTSGGNSCIDTEQGYTYKSGYVVAMCPQGMTQECEKVSGSLSSYGKSTTMSLTSGYYLTISNMVVVKLPTSISSGYVIELGNSSASISQASQSSYTFDDNGVYWLV